MVTPARSLFNSSSFLIASCKCLGMILLSVPGKFENLCCQILHHSSHVDWGTSAHTLRIIALPEQPVNTTHGKLKSGATRPRLGLAFYLPSFPAARHCSSDLEGVVTVANVQRKIRLVQAGPRRSESTWSWCTWSPPWYPQRLHAWPTRQAAEALQQSVSPEK